LTTGRILTDGLTDRQLLSDLDICVSSASHHTTIRLG